MLRGLIHLDAVQIIIILHAKFGGTKDFGARPMSADTSNNSKVFLMSSSLGRTQNEDTKSEGEYCQSEDYVAFALIVFFSGTE